MKGGRIMVHGTMDTRSRALALCLFVPMALSATVGPTRAERDGAQTVQKQSLTLDAARKVLAAAEAEAARNGWTSTIAVVDESGYIIAIERMDGARYAGLYLAPGKARSAALFRRPTKVLEDAINNGRTAQVTLPDMVQMEGGLPVIINGEVVGAVGVSGDSKQQDSQIAQAGLDALEQPAE